VILLGSVSSLHDAQEPASKLVEIVSEPYFINDLTLKLSTSIGIALFPDDADNVEALINAADSALYEAKRAGKNRVCWSSGSDASAKPAVKSVMPSIA